MPEFEFKFGRLLTLKTNGKRFVFRPRHPGNGSWRRWMSPHLTVFADEPDKPQEPFRPHFSESKRPDGREPQRLFPFTFKNATAKGRTFSKAFEEFASERVLPRIKPVSLAELTEAGWLHDARGEEHAVKALEKNFKVGRHAFKLTWERTEAATRDFLVSYLESLESISTLDPRPATFRTTWAVRVVGEGDDLETMHLCFYPSGINGHPSGWFSIPTDALPAEDVLQFLSTHVSPKVWQFIRLALKFLGAKGSPEGRQFLDDLAAGRRPKEHPEEAGIVDGRVAVRLP